MKRDISGIMIYIRGYQHMNSSNVFILTNDDTGRWTSTRTRAHFKMYAVSMYTRMKVEKSPKPLVGLGLGVRLTPARTNIQSCSVITQRIPGSPGLWFVCIRAHKIAQPIGTQQKSIQLILSLLVGRKHEFSF